MSRNKDAAPLPPALAIRELHAAYLGRPPTLRGVNLVMEEGERVGIIGLNGSGKTTLLRAVCGLLKPTSGSVAISGAPVVTGAFRPEVGLVFQNPDDQLFAPTVRDDVAFGPLNLGLSPEEIEARVQAALTAVGTLHLANRVPHHLSGGEKRMVAIAGVLAMQPRMVIYDEPEASLDSRARRRLINLLLAARETLLIATHDLELVLEVCSRVVLLDTGRIVAEGTPAALISDAALMAAAGLERPFSLTAT
jgi:cobalt/nickel transport system ATP-binding protein